MVLYYELTTKLFCYPSQLNKAPLTTKLLEAQREGTHPRGAAAVGRSRGVAPGPSGRSHGLELWPAPWPRRAGAGAAGAALALLRAKRRLCLPAAQGAPRTAAAETPPAAQLGTWLPGSGAGWRNLRGQRHGGHEGALQIHPSQLPGGSVCNGGAWKLSGDPVCAPRRLPPPPAPAAARGDGDASPWARCHPPGLKGKG